MSIEAFFIGNYTVASYFSTEMSNIALEINVTSMSESYYSFSNNIIRQNIMDPNFNVVKIANSSELLSKNTDALISLVSNIEKTHSLNQGYQDSNYNNAYNQAFNMDLCQILVNINGLTDENKEQCNGFADGSLTQGLSLTFYRYIDNFKTIEGYIGMIRAGNLTNLSKVYKGNSDDILMILDNLNEKDNNLMNLLNLPQQQENNILQNDYLKLALRYLMEQQLETVKNSYASTINSRLVLYVCLIVLLFIIYLFFWLPTINQMNTNLFKIKKMLVIIPLEIIESNRLIKEKIQSFLEIHD